MLVDRIKNINKKLKIICWHWDRSLTKPVLTEIILFNFIKIPMCKTELKLPNRWNNKKCFDCGVRLNKINTSEWKVFRQICYKEYSVKICKKCMEKQDKELRKG